MSAYNGQDADQAVDLANQMLKKPANRTISPSSDSVEGSPGPSPGVVIPEGQLGPDELPDPDEVARAHEAKQ